MTWKPARKSAFDIVAGSILLVALLPLLLLCMGAILVLEGRPVFYVSRRRVYRETSIPIPKFRTMCRAADRIANRQTVPVAGTRFLNIPSNSPLYTPAGRMIERLMLTEMPQIVEVIRGRMSLVGNRPLPENVIDSLRETQPHVERRFMVPAGLTGPVQLVGRDALSDAERLEIEIAYCEAVAHSYSVMLDCRILFHTVVVGFLPGRQFTAQKALDLVSRRPSRPQPLFGRMRRALAPARTGTQ